MADKIYAYTGTDEGWADNVSPFLPSAVSPTTTPTFAAFGANGMYALKFAVGDIAFVNFHIEHDVLTGSTCYPHVHWSPGSTMSASETVVWTLEYVTAKGHNQGESLTGSLTTITLTHTADGTEVAGEHMVTEDSTGFTIPEIDSLVMFKVTLGNGTYAGDVFGHMVDIHYQVGQLNTPSRTPDFFA